ncbi:MAG: aminotransferase class III-fold pyridoxal phosphate-dependent enzyme [Alphaproteobacteria bacterium]|nr:aminotransferase class III-fold pyridoxal phosphate-dependent enzyme [Alphaproteobacteria bacterium]
MTTLALIQARMGSSRFPGKMLTDLCGKPLLQWCVEGASLIPGVDKVAVATSSAPSDDAIAAWCQANGAACHRGSEEDVLDRFYQAAKSEGAETVLRLVGDCPLLDPIVCGQVLMLLRMTGADYAASCNPPSWPDGLDAEAMTFAALETAAKHAKRKPEREHVTPWLRNNRHRFKVELLVCPLPNLSHERWTVDYPEDLEFLKAVIERLPKDRRPSYLDVLSVLMAEPDLRKINSGSVRNEGLARSLAAEPVPQERDYTASKAMFERAVKTIPLACQTFSKSHIQWPAPKAPLFLTHGEGGRSWDIDGNEYVDLVSGLLPVVLGYQDQDVDQAVRRQLTNGVSMSLATELETQLAERFARLIPCAEMVRFGKNGTDATSAAVRIARAATRRDRIAVCGYHGWQDWYIGATTRNKGVPAAVSGLTHMLAYNNLDKLRETLLSHPGEFAAIIMEPMGAIEPYQGFLAEMMELAHQHGALFVFDEVITGFRYALGGAQSYFSVTPDLACFGKAMANGLPIAAVVGKGRYMREMEEIFISSTFGGEALSLAASIATIDKMEREPVIERLWSTGARLATGARERIKAAGLEGVITLSGSAPWMILGVTDHPKARKEAIKTLFLREMLRAGILVNASHNVTYAHNEADVVNVLAAYESALSIVACELDGGKLEDRLGLPVIEPVFKVR